MALLTAAVLRTVVAAVPTLSCPTLTGSPFTAEAGVAEASAWTASAPPAAAAAVRMERRDRGADVWVIARASSCVGTGLAGDIRGVIPDQSPSRKGLTRRLG